MILQREKWCKLSLDMQQYLDILSNTWINSMWPSAAIWRHGTWSTLVQVMACCLTASSQYLTNVDSKLFALNFLKPGQGGYHIADDIFKLFFFNEKCCILIQGSSKFVPNGNIVKPTLFQIVAWRRTGDKPFSEPMMIQFSDAYVRHPATMG